MEITPRPWMSVTAGLIGLIAAPLTFAAIAMVTGLLTWNDGRLGKIGFGLGVIDFMIAMIILYG